MSWGRDIDMPRLPVVFVSHGAPDTLVNAPDTVACWRGIGERVGEPAAILVVSAHWEARVPTLSLAGAPATIHDFSGFSPALHRLRYPAPGAPALAERAAALLTAAGGAVELHPTRGLDHGAWVPLSAIYPSAQLPVTQLALVRGGGASCHRALGKALAPLRDEGVLIVASGAITHNFDWIDWQADALASPLPPAVEFAEWVAGRLAAGEADALLDYRTAPNGAAAHPTEEHFMPMLVAVGAAMDDVPTRLTPRFTYRGLAMDAYLWGADAA